MAMTPTFRRDAMLMAAGAAAFALLGAAVWHFRADPAAVLAAQQRRAGVVDAMRFDLAMATDAERSALLAVTDGESQAFADQARVRTADVEHARLEMEELLKAGGTSAEREFLAQFSRAFAELQRVDDELLRLAVKNTNVKASALLFGPAAAAIDEMDAALARVIAATGDGPEATKVLSAASGARISALRIESLLPPHIAEESAEKMDALEGRMAREDERVREDLAALRALTKDRGGADVKTASAAYDGFSASRARILALSRENSNVRSVAMSLNEKRRVLVLCQTALAALRQAVEDAVPRDAPVLPR